MMDDAERALVLSRLERLRLLLDELERTQNDVGRQRIRDRINRAMDAATRAVKVLGTHDPRRSGPLRDPSRLS